MFGHDGLLARLNPETISAAPSISDGCGYIPGIHFVGGQRWRQI